MWLCVVLLRVYPSIRDECGEIAELAILTFFFNAELLYFEFSIEYRRSRTFIYIFQVWHGMGHVLKVVACCGL